MIASYRSAGSWSAQLSNRTSVRGTGRSLTHAAWASLNVSPTPSPTPCCSTIGRSCAAHPHPTSSSRAPGRRRAGRRRRRPSGPARCRRRCVALRPQARRVGHRRAEPQGVELVGEVVVRADRGRRRPRRGRRAEHRRRVAPGLRHRSRRRHPPLRLGTARQHDPVERLLPEPEQGAAGGEVADEAPVDLGPDQLLGSVGAGPQRRAPRLEGADVVLRLGDEGLQPEVGLPAEDQLRQRRGHRLREDLRADQVGDRRRRRPGSPRWPALSRQMACSPNRPPGGATTRRGAKKAAVGRHLVLDRRARRGRSARTPRCRRWRRTAWSGS